MQKLKEISSSEIETLKYMLSLYYSKKEELISMQCKRYIITDLFMLEFFEYVTKESFSTSPGLKYSLIDKYKELFDLQLWINNKEKSLEPLLHSDFNMGPESLNKIFETVNPINITKEIYEKYKGILTKESKEKIVNESSITDEELIKNNYDSLNEKIFKNKKINIKWTNSLIEDIFNNKLLTVKFVIAALYDNNDFGFIKRMLTTDFRYNQNGETFDTELKNFINKISENYIGYLFDLLKKYSPNALSYTILNYVLTMKDFLDEQFLLENVPLFLGSGLSGELAKYARSRDYMSVLIVLKLN
jgi:hypothetical protein